MGLPIAPREMDDYHTPLKKAADPSHAHEQPKQGVHSSHKKKKLYVRSPRAESLVPLCDLIKRVEAMGSGLGKKGEAIRELEPSLGKLVIRVRGNCGVTNWARLPRIGELGLGMRYVYIEYRVEGPRGGLEVEACRRSTQERFRIALTSCRKNETPTVSGGCVKGVLPGDRDWTLLCVDVEACAKSMSSGVSRVTLKSITARAEIAVRGAWASNSDFSLEPRAAPKDLRQQSCQWHRFPALPPEVDDEQDQKHMVEPVVVQKQKTTVVNSSALVDDNERQEREWVAKYPARVGKCDMLVWTRLGPIYSSGRALCRVRHDKYEWWQPGAEPIDAMTASADGNNVACAASSRCSLWSCSGVGLQWQCDWTAHDGQTTALSFRDDGLALCSAGFDSRKRPQIAIWDAPRLPKREAVMTRGGGSEDFGCSARQLADFDVKRLRWSRYEPMTAIVSCGYENVRYWRLDDKKRGHLPGTSAALHEYARRTTMLDLDFAQHQVLVATDRGLLLQLSYADRSVLCALRLHESAITRVIATASFIATSSRDGLVRLWPHDFSDYLIEARHDSEVTDMLVTPGESPQVLCAQADGSLGELDMTSQSYLNLAKAHARPITDLAFSSASFLNNSKGVCATCSQDGTIRIWDLEDLHYVSEFTSGVDDKPTRLLFVADALIAGFESGAVRAIAQDEDTPVHRAHQFGPIQRLVTSATAYFSGAADGAVCAYSLDPLATEAPLRSTHVDVAQPLLRKCQPQQVDLAASLDVIAALTSRDPSRIFLFDHCLRRLSLVATAPEPLVDVAFSSLSTLWASAASGARYKLNTSTGRIEDHRKKTLSFPSSSSRWAKTNPEPSPALYDRVAVCSSADDDVLLATACADNIQLFSLDGARGRQRLKHAHAAEVTRLAFSPDGTVLASADASGCVCFWRRSPAQSLLQNETAVVVDRFEEECRDACWVEDMVIGAVGSSKLIVKSLDEGVSSASFTQPDGPIVRVAAQTHNLIAIATATRVTLFTLNQGLLDEVASVNFAGARHLVATAESAYAANESDIIEMPSLNVSHLQIQAACATPQNTCLVANGHVLSDLDAGLVVQRERAQPREANAIAASETAIAIASTNHLSILTDNESWRHVANTYGPVFNLALQEEPVSKLYVATPDHLVVYEFDSHGTLRPSSLLRLESTLVSITPHPEACVLFCRDGTLLAYFPTSVPEQSVYSDLVADGAAKDDYELLALSCESPASP